MAEVFVGFGSNVEPARHLLEAVELVGRQFGPLRCSAVFRSPAYGFRGDAFLNLVAGFASEVGPEQVEALLSSIEHAEGRMRGALRYAPRTLDLDLLIYGHCVDAGRRLPRDDVLRYPFVLAPLAELAPGLRHPVTGTSIADHWQAMAASAPRLRRLGHIDCLT